VTLGEDAFIASIRALATAPAARGLQDDCAVIELGGEMLILTHDMMVEGIHWLSEQDAADVAWKLVAANLSDLAAKGAQPVGVLLGYTLGPDDVRFVSGLREAMSAFATPVLGGDTVSSNGMRSHGLTALGRATCRPVPSRSGAREGDSIWITGTLGAAMIGFEALRDGQTDVDSTAFRRPVPRLADGRALAPMVSAMMDISDGLLLDARRMAQASCVTIAIDSAAVPLGKNVPESRRADALAWGEDFELLFALPPGSTPPCAATRVGIVKNQGDDPILVDGVAPSGKLGYQHGQQRD
jgi:thiamine-monophosphate kinase